MKKVIMFIGIMLIAQVVYGASFTITIPNGKIQQLIEAFAVRFNYQETIPNPDYPEDPEAEEMIPNPQSKEQFTKKHIIRIIKDVYRSYKANIGTEQGRQTALEEAEIDMENITIE